MIKKQLWGQYKNQEIFQYHITAGNYKAIVSNYGALLTHFYCPDKNGQYADIVLGFNEFDNYLHKSPYFGATIGRFGNRIKNGQFSLHGTTYQLTQNDGKNHLHGGLEGFDKKIWNCQELADNQSIKLSYISPHKEEGYPGNLTTNITYTLLNNGSLIYKVQASCDQDTVCSIVNHSYFNLQGFGDILNHKLQINAQYYSEIDHQRIPTGKLLPTKNTGLDFTSPQILGEATKQMPHNIYDHNLILDGEVGHLRKVATLKDTISHRTLEVHTSLPCLQIYNSAEMGRSNIKSKDGKTYPNFSALCLETQFAPNSPNIPSFDPPHLKAGETWEHITIFKCSI